MAAPARRIAQVTAWARCRRQYALTLGGASLGYEHLTDDAFQALRDRIAADVRRERAGRARREAMKERMRAAADRIAEHDFGRAA